MKNLLYRVITSVVLLPIVIAAFILGGYYLAALLCLVCLVSALEASSIVDAQGKLSKLLAIVFSMGFFIPALFCRDLSFLTAIVPVIVIFNGTVLFYGSLNHNNFEKLCTIFYWSFYINVAIASIYWLMNTPWSLHTRTGLSFILLACLATWANDTFAYLFGRVFGKHPLFKSVSGKKTWEGFLAGSTLSVALVLVFKYAPMAFGFDWLSGLHMGDLLWIALPAIVLAPFGDLIESRFKRLYDVKDSSQILPGHGGLLDRIDGLLMVMPWTALYAFIIRPLCY